MGMEAWQRLHITIAQCCNRYRSFQLHCGNAVRCAVAQAHVANVVLAAGLRGQGGAAAAEQAARQVARAQAKALLLPLLDTAIARLAAVLRRTWQLAVDHAVPEGDTLSC